MRLKLWSIGDACVTNSALSWEKTVMIICITNMGEQKGITDLMFPDQAPPFLWSYVPVP
ncbi:hypothetical protein GCM10010965_21600 [Caldalkalibacillus thermarum]|nr:hypothetical protein GCM10010965_21600 [Caldalkalibacillus thermarum]